MTEKSALAVIAQFDVKPGEMEHFLEIARADATRSVMDEPGCLQFDIAVSADEPNLVTFYEVYLSRAAFDAHLQTPHLKRFKELFPELVECERTVRFLSCEHRHVSGE